MTTVAVTEDTLGTLNANGVVTYKRDGDETLLSFAPGFPSERPRVIQMLAHKAPGLVVTPEGARRPAGRVALAAVQHHPHRAGRGQPWRRSSATACWSRRAW